MQKYIAKVDADLLYTYHLGGGVNGRKVKKGDVITKVSERIDISSVNVETMELLYAIPKDSFDKIFKKY